MLWTPNASFHPTAKALHVVVRRIHTAGWTKSDRTLDNVARPPGHSCRILGTGGGWSARIPLAPLRLSVRAYTASLEM